MPILVWWEKEFLFRNVGADFGVLFDAPSVTSTGDTGAGVDRGCTAVWYMELRQATTGAAASATEWLEKQKL